MTIVDAIGEVKRVGSIRVENGKLKLRFPEPERTRLEPAIDALRRNRQIALEVISSGAVPSSELWPESLKELADERAAAARREVWMSWTEWKARGLNRLFLEKGATGETGRITAETVRHGERKAGESWKALK